MPATYCWLVHVANLLGVTVAEEALDHPCLADEVGSPRAVSVEELVEGARGLAQHEIHVVHRVREDRAELRPILYHEMQHDERVVCGKLGDDVQRIYAHVRYAHRGGVDPANDVLPQEEVNEHGLCHRRLRLSVHRLARHVRAVAVVPRVDQS
jgi:hypothetical protein